MRRRQRGMHVGWIAAVLPMMAIVGCGCAKTLAFGTATKFALDISQKADQTVDVSMGYDRAEIAAIPVPPGNATEAGEDTYSVLGTFYVTYGNPWDPTDEEGIHLNQFFATGMAAKKASQSSRFRDFFGRSAGVIEKKKEK